MGYRVYRWMKDLLKVRSDGEPIVFHRDGDDGLHFINNLSFSSLLLFLSV